MCIDTFLYETLQFRQIVVIQLNCITNALCNCCSTISQWKQQLYVTNNRTNIYRCLSTSGLSHFGPGQLVLGTNHFGHRHFPSLGVIPANFATIFISPETRMILPPDSEIHTIVASIISTQYQHVTEGQRDGRQGHSKYSARITSNADAL